VEDYKDINNWGYSAQRLDGGNNDYYFYPANEDEFKRLAHESGGISWKFIPKNSDEAIPLLKHESKVSKKFTENLRTRMSTTTIKNKDISKIFQNTIIAATPIDLKEALTEISKLLCIEEIPQDKIENEILKAKLNPNYNINEKIIYFIVGWMKHYDYDKYGINDDPIIGGGKYPKEKGYGHEGFNFQERTENNFTGYFGYCSQDNSNKGIRLDKHFPECFNNGKVENFKVVFLATSPEEKGFELIGWYDDAIVYKESQKSSKILKGNNVKYFARTSAGNAHLIPACLRPKLKYELICQSPVYYGNPEMNEEVKKRIEYIEITGQDLLNEEKIAEEFQASPDKYLSVVSKYDRDPEKVRKLKYLYEYKCQICGQETGIDFCNGKKYIEVHHIKALKFDGYDNEDNMMVVCPNCHKRLDYLAQMLILPQLKIDKHVINPKYIDFYNEKVKTKKR